MADELQLSSAPFGIYRSLPPDSIRLLRLQPAKSLQAPLIATFDEIELPKYSEVHVDESDGVDYEALSYAWDGAFKDQPLPDGQMLLEGCQVKIKGNLHDALRRLRFETEPRMIWADAVCINQGDVPERSAQVAIMARIYSNATQVVMWLGEDSADGDGEAFMTYCWNLDRTMQSGVRKLVLFVHQEFFGSTKLAGFSWRPKRRERLIGQFTNRLYFSRKWCVQEVVYAPRLLVMCGCHSIPMYRLENIREWLSFRSQPVFSFNPAIDQLQWLKSIDGGALSVLAAGQDLECRDKRDHIYSFASLLEHQSDCPKILLDYELPWTTVYASFARGFIMSNGYVASWKLLLYTAKQHNCELGGRHAELPSWVPDWSYHTGTLNGWGYPTEGSSVVICSDVAVELPLAYYGTLGAALTAGYIDEAVLEHTVREVEAEDCFYGLNPEYDKPDLKGRRYGLAGEIRYGLSGQYNEPDRSKHFLILRPCSEARCTFSLVGNINIERDLIEVAYVALHDIVIR